MADTVTIEGQVWSTEGLPRHMVAGLPHTVEVTMPVTFGQRIMRGAEPTVHTVQLERDGKPLTLGDRAPSWTPGEAEGWRPTRWTQQAPAEEVIDVEVIEC